jgi:hypothetical protein
VDALLYAGALVLLFREPARTPLPAEEHLSSEGSAEPMGAWRGAARGQSQGGEGARGMSAATAPRAQTGSCWHTCLGQLGLEPGLFQHFSQVDGQLLLRQVRAVLHGHSLRSLFSSSVTSSSAVASSLGVSRTPFSMGKAPVSWGTGVSEGTLAYKAVRENNW